MPKLGDELAKMLMKASKWSNATGMASGPEF